jgi:hypothetical protein
MPVRGTASGSLFKISGRRYAIPSSERDRALLTGGTWPEEAATHHESGWRPRQGHLFRQIRVESETGSSQRLWEAMLPFPNSPVFTTHRGRKYAYPLPPWPNLHTMRVIGRGAEPGAQIKHVYLLHNGLNETNDLLFHYRLAAWILGVSEESVCILRPLPGHLTRFPFSGLYAELPLDSYLRDPAFLFRQFLRYMQETQWLLSVLVPRPSYAVVAGTRLLAEARPKRRGTLPGRARNKNLAAAITEEWRTAFDSTEEADREKRLDSTHSKQPVTEPRIAMIVDELRGLLGWKPTVTRLPPGAAGGRSGARAEPPSVHVVGYSMGGFMAQAAFFAWPFAIASCTNLFAGGALRDLAPTAFAHPEEWQAVLHGLRYELDRAFREGYLDSKDGRTAGLIDDDFGYFTRIFYEVYLQYYRGGYASRVAEFSRRLLFVVGGDDPIVRTKNVLDAGPPQGITLLQIADVSHFPGGRPRGLSHDGKVENEQRQYWLPEVGRIIAGFSRQSEGLLHRTLAECWRTPATASSRNKADTGAPIDILSPAQPSDLDPTMLSSMAFASELRELIDCAGTVSTEGEATRGWLLVARNELSPVFLGPAAFPYFAQAIHHSEDQIARYIRVLSERTSRLKKLTPRISMLIPTDCRERLNSLDWRTMFAKSETPSAARVPSDDELVEILDTFEREWKARGAVGVVTPNEYRPSDLAPIGPIEADRLSLMDIPLTVLPDVWIALSGDACKAIRGAGEDNRETNEDAVIKWATRLARDLAKSGESDKRAEIDRLKRWIDGGDVVAITVSGAELNPRYRGHRLLDKVDVSKVVVHWALAYRASDIGALASSAT